MNKFLRLCFGAEAGEVANGRGKETNGDLK